VFLEGGLEIVEDSTTEVDERYRTAVAAFRKSIAQAVTASTQRSGLQAGERRFWSSVIFLRACLVANSLNKLCPELTGPRIDVQWAFASIASLTRNLFECLMFFCYFTEKCDQDEWLAKLNVMQLRDCTERIALFETLKNHEEVAAFRMEIEILREKLVNNAFFQSLDGKLRKDLLQGYRARIPTLRQIVDVHLSGDGFAWFMYQWLSSYAHSFPAS
jgi:hypothetical protein